MQVCSNGTVYVMMFTNDTCHWAECGSFQLNCADAVVTKAIMNGRGQLLYLVQQLGESDWNYSIHKDTLHQGNVAFQFHYVWTFSYVYNN